MEEPWILIGGSIKKQDISLVPVPSADKRRYSIFTSMDEGVTACARLSESEAQKPLMPSKIKKIKDHCLSLTYF
ncbi:hypothetical protein [Salipaludibacillus sp. CF4.18]|uniref:hypothetical protein n=1 Tax=Salipaludibacillus sp. CF4.18 TaxID=3373081 RepID=UPI003EE61432